MFDISFRLAAFDPLRTPKSSISICRMGVVGTTLAIVSGVGLLGAAWLSDKIRDGPFSRGGPPRTFIINLLLVLAAWVIILTLGDDAAGPLPLFLMLGETILTGLLPLNFTRLLFEDRGSNRAPGFEQKAALVGVIGLGLLSSWYLNFLFAASGSLLPVPGDYVEYGVALVLFPALTVGLGFVAFRSPK